VVVVAEEIDVAASDGPIVTCRERPPAFCPDTLQGFTRGKIGISGGTAVGGRRRSKVGRRGSRSTGAGVIEADAERKRGSAGTRGEDHGDQGARESRMATRFHG